MKDYTLEELKELLTRVYEKIPPLAIRSAAKELQIKRLHQSAIDCLRWCVAIQIVGLPITINLMRELIPKSPSSLRHRLHILGDKRLLTLIRKGDRCRWVVHPSLLKRLPLEEVRKFVEEILLCESEY